MKIKYIFYDECECGCGQNAKPGNRFIHNHHRKGKYHTEETKLRMYENNVGANNPCYKRIRPTEERERISLSMRNRKKSLSHISNVAKANTGKKRTEEQNRRNKERAIIQFSDPKQRELARINAINQWLNPTIREKCLQKLQENINKESVRLKISQSVKKLWKNSEYVEKIRMGLNIHPNKPETFLLNLLNELYPGEWKFTGDFSFTINGKNPDFTNCNGQKKLIELFGDYWHQGEKPEDRKAIFREFGYETLVIWEHELKDMNYVLFQLEEFIKE